MKQTIEVKQYIELQKQKLRKRMQKIGRLGGLANKKKGKEYFQMIRQGKKQK